MESNEITCPQCGLKNNMLADACVQCGIIFVKNAAMKAAQNVQDDERRKAIEEAEAMLDQTQPPSGIDAVGNDAVKRPDPHEDTVEMQIPKEEDLEIKPKASAQEEPKPEENQEPQKTEIEMAAIETPVEDVVDTTTEPEELFLTEVDANKPAEPQTAAAVEKPVENAPGTEKTADAKSPAIQLDAVKENSADQKQDAMEVKAPETQPPAKTKPGEAKIEMKPETAKSEAAAPAEAETPSTGVFDTSKTNSDSTSKSADKPAEQEIKIEENAGPAAADEKSVQAEAPVHAEATIEMPQETIDEDALKKEKEAQVREALKKQREAQVKAEAQEKEKAAQAKAAALKKKKLAKTRAEALKKQKAAQAKAEALKKKKKAQAKAIALKKQKATQVQAEALKKQKEDQTRAEASAPEVQVASTGTQFAPAESVHTHVKLLNLLKRYKGKAIGINYDNSSEIKAAELLDANEEFFSIMVKDKKLQYNYPLKTILTIVEGQDGVETGKDDQKAKFDAVIKVYPMVFV